MTTDNPFPDRLNKLFQAEKDILLSEIRRAGGEFTHGGLKGTSGEQIAKNFLRRYIPSSYGFANGQIIDSKGNISKEVDVAVCNPSHPLTYEPNGQGVFFIESVDAVIEVKSKITNLDALKDHCKSVRDCRPDNYFLGMQQTAAVPFDRIDKTPYAVFAFESRYKLDTIVDRLNTWDEDERYFIDLIYILNKGIILYNYEKMTADTDRLGIPGLDQGEYGLSPYDPDLLMFLIYLSDKLPDIQSAFNPLPVYFDTTQDD